MTSRISLRFCSFLVVLLAFVSVPSAIFAVVRTNAVPQVRVTRTIDNAKRKTLYGHTPKALRRASKLGRVDASTRAQHLIIALKSSQEQEREARRIIDEQQDRHSANYHQWMTPDEFGTHFGVHDADIESVKAWLNSQGFTVESVSKSKRSIQFTGSIGQVEQAFQTEMHYFLMPNGETHVSNDRDISVPEALSPVVAGVPTLNNFFRRPHHTEFKKLSRARSGGNFSFGGGANCGLLTTGNNDCFVGPGDFATIYNTTPLLAQGINGTGVTIGVVGRSDILMSDVQTYRQMFNLPVNDPIFINAGQDNGIEAGDDGESDLDVEISGGIAPNATVKFVVGTPTFLVDGITNSIQYLVENNNVDIISTSYGGCESEEGAGGNSFNSQMFEQAAAQGISVFVADGDNGPAECDDSNDTFEALGYAASAEGSTPYGVSVGGTMFVEGANSSTYWGANNDSITGNSALGYIPEAPWNEAKSASPAFAPTADLEGLWSGSGGISAYYLLPSWQAGPGVPTSDPVLTQGGNWITVAITNPGSGYITAPSVTFAGETCASNPVTASTVLGTGAQAGQVVAINFTFGTQGGTVRTGQGFGCTVAGTVAFTAAPAGGTTATGTTALAPMQNMLPIIPGVPHRYTPDLSLNAAAEHDGTIFCSEGVCAIDPTGAVDEFGIVGGTSVAAPSMAGIQALIDQANGGRQGMPGYIYYGLAAAQSATSCNSSLAPSPSAGCAFQDVTIGNTFICGTSTCTTTPAKIGFPATTGYDFATGLGSVNAANLSNQWGSVVFNASNTTLNLSQTTFAHGTPITLNGTVGGSGTPTGDVAFIVSQGAIGDTVNVDTGALNGPAAYTTLSGGSYTTSLNNLPGGTYFVTARYGGDGTFASSYSASTQVTVSSESSGFTLTASSPNALTTCSLTNPVSYPYGSNILIDAQVTSASGAGAATGTVTISDNGTPIATNQTLDPNGHVFLLSGPVSSANCLYQYDFSNTSTFTVGTHNLTATYSGDASMDAVSATPITVVVTQAAPTLSLAAGASQITSGFGEQLTATFGALTPITGGSTGSLAPSGTVTFTDTTTAAVLGIANVTSTSVTTINAQSTAFTALAVLQTSGITATGANAITATYSGDNNWAPITSAAVTVTVGTFTTATTTTVTNAGTGTAGNPTILGGRPTFTATVTGGTGPTTGTVTFYDTTTTNNLSNLPAGTYVLGTGAVGAAHTATLRLAAATLFGGGTHNITATYGGVTTTFGPSTSAPFVQTVTPGTVTNFLTTKTVGKTGQAYYLTADITPSSTAAAFQPTANVQFFDGATLLGSAPLTSISGNNGGFGIYEASLNVTTFTAGTHTITALYPGDTNYASAPSNAQTVFVGGTPTVTWATPTPITYGTALGAAQLNATANIPGAFVYSPPAGTVLNVGSQPLSVTFTPSDNTDFGPQPGNVTLLVNQASQIINFSINAPATAAFSSSFTVAATGGASGNPVVFTSAGSCSNVGATYTMTSGTGSCSVIANQAGNTNYSAAPQVTQTVNTSMIAQIITFTVNAPATAAFNSSFTVAATGGGSSNPVVFTSAGSCSNAGATYTMTSGTGTCSVIANQAGDANYSAAPQVTQSTTATPLSQSITFTINAPASAVFQSSFTVAASATSGLPVAFTSAGACSNVGATYTMTSGSGTCSVIANQAGNSNYSAAPQSTQSTTATGLGQTITFSVNAPGSAAYNSSFTVAASASSGLPVVFTSAGACSNAGATYTMTSGTGTCSVIANQPGNANFPAAPQVTQSTTATKLGQTIAFTVNPPAAAPYQSSFSVAASATSGDAVTFTSAGACSNAGATYTMTAATGTCSVIANQAGDGNYTAAPQVTRTTTAAKAAPTVTFIGAPATAPYLSSFTVIATTNASTTAVITSTTATCTRSGDTITIAKGTGTCTVTAKWAADTHYLAASVSQAVTLEKLVPVITWPTPDAVPYGTALSATQLDATASFNDTTIAGVLTYLPKAGKVLIAGSQTLSATFTPTNKADFATVSDTVTLTVNQIGTTATITGITPVAPKVSQLVHVRFNVAAAFGKPTQSVVVTSTTGETCSAALAGGNGTCTLVFATSGARTLTATYNGDQNDLPSTSAGFSVTIP